MGDISVLIADSQLTFADALAIALRHSGLRVFEALPRSGIEAIDAAIMHKPDVALLDYWLEDMDAWAVVRTIHERSPATKILHLSWFHGPTQVQDSLTAGAVGFLPKALRVSRIEEAIRRAVDGESPVFEKGLEELVRRVDEANEQRQRYFEFIRGRLATLTPREIEVLKLIARGFSVTDIADKLSISAATVRNHIHHVLEKTTAKTRLEAVAVAREQGLIQ